MKFKADEIASVIQQEIEHFESRIDVREVGRVIELGDGIARVYGLSEVMSGEMVEVPRRPFGLAFNLEENSVGVIILGDFLAINEGDEVRGTGRLLSVPVGDAVLGRVIDPLGNPLDGGGPIATTERRRSSRTPPAWPAASRSSVPLQTGIKAIDAMTPIGRGQRELIIGDRKTGKTAICIDTIINQKGTGVKCFYVAIGQKESTVAGLIEVLREHGAMDYTTVVVAGASDPAPLQYIAPYAGCAMAEYFTYKGQDALIVYDDLSKQAAAYRQISLLMRPPAGPRGLSRRHLLLPQPAAGAGGQAERRAGRRIAHRAADRRNPRRRGLGLHPHERDFDHRRADLLAARPVLRRSAAGDERGHFRFARGRGGPGAGDEEGGRRPAARPGLVPRAGSLRPIGHRPRRRHAIAARPRLPHDGAVEAGPLSAHARHRPGAEHLRRHPRTSRQDCRSRKSTPGKKASWSSSTPSERSCGRRSPTRRKLDDDRPTPIDQAIAEFQQRYAGTKKETVRV